MKDSTSTQRRDEHRPVNLVTEDYTYVEAYDSQLRPPPMPDSRDEEVLAAWRETCDAVRRHMRDLRDLVATSSVHRGLSQCHHCGAHIRYGAIMHHRPSDTYIAVGETCLENRFERATVDFQRLRKVAQLDRERRRIVGLKEEFRALYPDLAWMLVEPDDSWPADVRENDFVCDVARKLRRYGSLSTRQVDAVRKVWDRAEARRREREAEVWVPIPTELFGRSARITGTILTTRWQASQFGETLKMLVKVDANVGDGGSFKVWTTVPKAAGEVQRGDTISLIGELDVSDDDPSFGFMRRPRLNKEEA